MKDLIIIGAGGFGRELLQWCKDINSISPKWSIKGFLDDNPAALDGVECDIPVIGSISNWNPSNYEEYAIAIANPSIKEKVVSLLGGKGAKFTSIIHPTAAIGSFNKIGKGLVMYPNARINVNITIGDFVTILDNTAIGHDAKLGDYTTICGNGSVNGHVILGRKVFFGTHVSTIPGITIGDNAYIGAGSVVMTNIKNDARVFGVPARKMTPTSD